MTNIMHIYNCYIREEETASDLTPPLDQSLEAGMLSSGRPSQAAAAFTEQQLKQFRAQCLVFLAVR